MFITWSLICLNSNHNKAVIHSPLNVIICQTFVFYTFYNIRNKTTFLNVSPAHLTFSYYALALLLNSKLAWVWFLIVSTLFSLNIFFGIENCHSFCNSWYYLVFLTYMYSKIHDWLYHPPSITRTVTQVTRSFRSEIAASLDAARKKKLPVQTKQTLINFVKGEAQLQAVADQPDS